MLHENLKKAREDKKFSRKKLAQILEIHESTYGKYELGLREPDTKTLIRIAKELDSSVEYLLLGHILVAQNEKDYSADTEQSLNEFRKDASNIINRLSDDSLEHQLLPYLRFLISREETK